MLRRRFISTACLAIAGIYLSSSAVVAQASADTAVIVQSADAYSMDPAKHSAYPTASILFNIYDGLVTLDAEGKFKPALATSWSNPDPTTWRFKLREGVKFHNGEPFDANAVKFTFDRALDPNFKAPYYSRISAIKSVTAIDPQTVDFKTDKPYPTMLYALYEASFPALIVPPKYASENNGEAIARKPVGTGPYRFVEWVRDDRVVLEANPDYWGGAPRIKKIVFRPIKETRTRIAELRSGGVDLIGDVPPEDVPGLNRGDTKASAIPSDLLYFFAFDTLKVSPLQDKRVRQALNHAVDVDAIQKAILGGLGQRIPVTLLRGALGDDGSLKPYPFDPAKAKALLAEAGFPNGFTIPLNSRQGRYLKDKEIMEATIGYLARVGVKVEAKYMEPGVWAQVSEKKGREGLIFPGWSGMDPDLVLYPLLYSGQYQSYYSNPKLDALLDRGRSTLDTAERASAYKEAALLMIEEAVHIPMLQPPLIYGLSKRLSWQPRTDSIIDMRKAEIR